MRKTVLTILLSFTLLLTACNGDTNGSSIKDSSMPTSTEIQSSEPSSSIKASSLPPPVNGHEYKAITKSDIIGDVDSIEKITINVRMFEAPKERDLTKEEIEQFRELFNAMEMTANVLEIGAPPGAGQAGTVQIFMADDIQTSFMPSMDFVFVSEFGAGDLYITKGGDEMMNFIWGLDIYAEAGSGFKVPHINGYIDHQERNDIPTTLERIPEE